MSGQIRWPSGPKKPYQDSLHQFVTWMLKPQVELRPTIDDVIIHIDKVLAKFS
jgi:serine/threonine kinase 16